MKLRRFCALACLFACFSVIAPAFAATLVVDEDLADCPHADFRSIQEAVAAAQSGDKILVCPGRYLESVEVNKSEIRIEAKAAPGEVVLQGTPAQDFGFRLLNTTGVLVQGFTVQGFRTANIRIEGGSRNTLRKNITTKLVGISSTNQGSSIQVFNSSANIVEHNISFANCPFCNGISVRGAASSDNTVRGNDTFQNGQAGLQANGSGPRNVLLGNRSHDNGIGIRNILGSHGNVIENNQVYANRPADPPAGAESGGIIVGASTLVTVRNNRSEGNDPFGIRLQNGASNNLIEKNEVFQNDQDGIRLEPTVAAGTLPVTANVVQLNHVRRNVRDGIRVFSSLARDNTIERNVIRESGEHDAHDDSVGAGTGGTANLWIENKCETENRPELCKNPDH
jgi:parallel beta-helix repeat protein